MPGYAILMGPDKTETAVHSCQCSGDMAVRMRKYWPYRGVVSCNPLHLNWVSTIKFETSLGDQRS